MWAMLSLWAPARVYDVVSRGLTFVEAFIQVRPSCIWDSRSNWWALNSARFSCQRSNSEAAKGTRQVRLPNGVREVLALAKGRLVIRRFGDSPLWFTSSLPRPPLPPPYSTLSLLLAWFSVFFFALSLTHVHVALSAPSPLLSNPKKARPPHRTRRRRRRPASSCRRA